MLISHARRLLDKYRPLFLGLLLVGIHFSGGAQTYNPSTCCTVSNKSYGAAQAVSTDGRSWFYDATNFVMRDYNGTTEVLSYLNLAKYRSGHFPIFVHSGGILQGNGVWLGGTTLVYWFKDSTGNANLVRWYTDSTGVPGGPFFAVANNLSEGNAGLIKGNLSLDNVDNTSDAQKNAAAVSITNHTINGNNNTLLNIPNSALTNNSIGLTVNANAAADISVTSTPAALGTSLVVNMPDAGTASRGPLTSVDWNFFNGKLDSVHISNDSVYNCVNGTCTLQSLISGAGAVNSVDGTNTSLLFSPTTGNVLGQVNPAFAFNWTGQHTFTSFAPIFSTLTTSGGLFYGNGSGQLLQTGGGTSGQILQSAGGAAPVYFTPDASTVTGWLNYTPLSSALGSTHLYVGNGSNIATDVALSGDATLLNTGALTNTGLRNKTIPALSAGFLQYDGANWQFNNTVLTDPLTTNGDILARVGGVTTRLPQGSNNTFLGVQSSTLGYYAPFALTTTGSSGVATFSAGTLNIPNYTSSGGSNSNIGSGHRWAVPGTSNIKTFFANAPLFLDSTSNTNALTARADTSTANTGLTTLYQNGLKITAPSFLGNLYVQNTWANTADFTLQGTPTFAASGGKLTLSGGNQQPSATVGTTNAAFNQVVKIAAYGGTMLERWLMIDSFVVNNAPGATTYGIGIGHYSTAAAGLSNAIGYFNASTATGTGTVSLLLGASNTTAAISPTALAFSNGDTIVLAVERIQDRITVTARNIHTNSASVTVSYTWDQSTSTGIVTPNTGVFGVVNFGGAYIINSISVTSNEAIGANICLVGDSKFAGYSTGWDMRIGSQLNRIFPATIVCAGQSDRTQDVLNHLHEVIALNPRMVILCVGRNDISGGVSNATMQANLNSIASQLTTANIPFYTLDAIYETAVSQTNLINFIDTAVAFRNKYIQTYVPGNFAGSVATDNIHPSYLGAQLVADIIRDQYLIANNGKFLNDRFPIRSQVPSYDSLLLYGTINMMNIRATNGNGPYFPAIRSSGDILMASGNALTASYGAAAQQNRLILSGAGSAVMEFRAYTGGLPLNNIFAFYTAGNTTGNQALALSITENGSMKTGSGTVISANSVNGDINVQINSAIRSTSQTGGGNETAIVPHNTGDNSMEFRNYDSLGHFKWFQAFYNKSTQTQTMSLARRGGLLLGTTTEDTSAIFNATSTTKGVLFPRMTTTQINAVPTPATGLHAQNTDSSGGLLGYYNGSSYQYYADRNWVRSNFSAPLTVGTFSGASDAKGLDIASNVLTAHPADASNPGMVTTGPQTFAGAKTYNATVTGNSLGIFFHYISGAAPPTLTGASGSGTGATLSVTGTDQDGVLTITTGTSCAANSTVVTATYTLAFITNSFPTLTPANNITAALPDAVRVFTTGTTTTFTLTSGSTPLTDATTYKWYYHVGGN